MNLIFTYSVWATKVMILQNWAKFGFSYNNNIFNIENKYILEFLYLSFEFLAFLWIFLHSEADLVMTNI